MFVACARPDLAVEDDRGHGAFIVGFDSDTGEPWVFVPGASAKALPVGVVASEGDWGPWTIKIVLPQVQQRVEVPLPLNNQLRLPNLRQ